MNCFELFRTEPLSWMQWAEVIGFTSLLAVGGEIIRAIHRKRKQCKGQNENSKRDKRDETIVK